MTKRSLSIPILLAFVSSAFAAIPKVSWYLVDNSLNEAGNSLNLGAHTHDINLNGGWSCTVGPTSMQSPSYIARQVTCQNEEKIFEFSVQCEPGKMKDHTQIRFKGASGEFIDFVEVGCELAE